MQAFMRLSNLIFMSYASLDKCCQNVISSFFLLDEAKSCKLLEMDLRIGIFFLFICMFFNH